MAEIHRLLEEHGKEKVIALKTHSREVIKAAAGFMGAENGDIGFLYSLQALAALPHKKIPDDASWQVHTDYVSLIVQPGLRSSLTGEAVSVGVPFGSRARLIFIYLQTEALKMNSREVPLGESLHAWLQLMGIPIGGKSMKLVREQAERISRCRMTFQIKQGNRTGLDNRNILDTAVFVEDDTQKAPHFIKTAKLSETFFEQLKKHPVPIEDAAIKEIANNSAAIDIYCWLAYHLYALTQPSLVTWKSLHAQLGTGLKRLDHFRDNFKKNLELASAVYPDAKFEVDERGVTIQPSNPAVRPKIASAPHLKG